MPSTFPTTADTWPTNQTDATASPTTHKNDHANANDSINKIETEILTNVARKSLAVDLLDRISVRLKTFLGRTNNMSNLWSSAILEVDARTTVQGHPDGGWPSGTSGIWVLTNADGSPAYSCHVEGGVGGTVFYVSHPDAGMLIKNQINSPLNNWGIYTADTLGVYHVRMEWPSGVAAGGSVIDSPEHFRAQGGLMVGNNFDEINAIRRGSATWNPASIGIGASATTTVTVTGAAVGDPCFAGFSSAVAGWRVTGTVSAADTVEITLTNLTGGAVDLGSGTVKAVVFKWT